MYSESLIPNQIQVDRQFILSKTKGDFYRLTIPVSIQNKNKQTKCYSEDTEKPKLIRKCYTTNKTLTESYFYSEPVTTIHPRI